MARLLITGGSGYLGSELVRLAPAAGWEVAATYHAQPITVAGLEAIHLDVCDRDAVVAAIRKTQPDVVIHTAYVQSGPHLWATTAEGAAHVAHAARLTGARLIHLSSDAIFDGERVGSYSEDDPPSPITPYGKAKAAAERFVAEELPGALIGRTSLIYGGATPGSHERLAIEAADGRADVVFFNDEIRCPVHVTDLAHALLELAVLDASGILHLGGADAVSRYEFATRVVAATGRSTAGLRQGSSRESGLQRPRNCALDSTRADRLLQVRLRGVREIRG